MKSIKNVSKVLIICSLAAFAVVFLLLFQTEQAAARQNFEQINCQPVFHNRKEFRSQLLKEEHGHQHDHHEPQTEKQTVWNLQKADRLRQKMMVYRPSNQGRFREYWVGTSLKWKGVSLPNQVISNVKNKQTFHVSIDGKDRQLQYSKTGEQAGWNVVAVFSNQNDAKASKKHTYFFIINDRKEALIIEPVSLNRKHIAFTSKVSRQLLSVFTSILAEH
ncbi:DUF4767 domain-containing protein [Streptococcus caviae]|uniref:DUF4767 domain-containing protein n=1 Tax=Streptococcus sp. 'caviae' TaxID=1915004 RepID=UPI00094B945E|nr:DUF4767 domain-containing protein [Streptococcus sp. 'caviae']OLN84817.1 hypothetical protein BMI76_01695 [Streptococcus sp. 'caviae']